MHCAVVIHALQLLPCMPTPRRALCASAAFVPSQPFKQYDKQSQPPFLHTNKLKKKKPLVGTFNLRYQVNSLPSSKLLSQRNLLLFVFPPRALFFLITLNLALRLL